MYELRGVDYLIACVFMQKNFGSDYFLIFLDFFFFFICPYIVINL